MYNLASPHFEENQNVATVSIHQKLPSLQFDQGNKAIDRECARWQWDEDLGVIRRQVHFLRASAVFLFGFYKRNNTAKRSASLTAAEFDKPEPIPSLESPLCSTDGAPTVLNVFTSPRGQLRSRLARPCPRFVHRPRGPGRSAKHNSRI